MIFVCLFSGCNDRLPEEQFQKLVLLTKNGWIEQSIDISDSTGVIKLPIAGSISGTSTNQENIELLLGYDTDTLNGYNFLKFRNQTELYYNVVPNEALSFDSNNINIVEGNDMGITNLFVDLDKITDKYIDYVIPIQIKSTSGYLLSNPKYSKALYHIQLKNKYSGNYTGEITVFKTKGSAEVNDDTQKITVGNKALYAITDTTCYFYAGQVDRNKVDRTKFIVNVTFHKDGTVTLDCPNTALNFIAESASISVSKVDNLNDKRYQNVTLTLITQYKFNDLAPTNPVRLRAQGTVSLTQTVLRK